MYLLMHRHPGLVALALVAIGGCATTHASESTSAAGRGRLVGEFSVPGGAAVECPPTAPAPGAACAPARGHEPYGAYCTYAPPRDPARTSGQDVCFCEQDGGWSCFHKPLAEPAAAR